MTKFLKLFKDSVLTKGYTSNKNKRIIHYIKLFTAGIIATVGLAQSSSYLIVGGLLISPLFDPISHIILYFYMNKHITFLLKHISYLIFDVIILFIIGYVGGYSFKKINAAYNAKNLKNEPVTKEMFYRTGYVPIIINSLICFLGGILMLTTFLTKDISYLIGITIAISFIIPIVNSGMLLYYNEHEASFESFLIFLGGLIFFLLSTIFFSYKYV